MQIVVPYRPKWMGLPINLAPEVPILLDIQNFSTQGRSSTSRLQALRGWASTAM